MAELADEFIVFRNKIALGKTQIRRIDSASETLSEKLMKHYGFGGDEVFLQGSIPNRTAVKPDPDSEDGEYDVDLVCVCAADEASPEEALAAVAHSLDALGYGNRIDADGSGSRPCVRLQYAKEEIGDFHVDVVPARHRHVGAPLEVPRPGHGWHESDPRRYTKWCLEQGEIFARTVQMLKRWRDHNQDARSAVKSITLQVLIAQELDATPSDGNRIAVTLGRIADFLERHDGVPEILNPALPSENLADRWGDADFHEFLSVVRVASTLAHEALGLDGAAACEKWRELFGSDFPSSGGSQESSSPKGPAPGTTRRRQIAPSHQGWGDA
jgi:hypothetical protein